MNERGKRQKSRQKSKEQTQILNIFQKHYHWYYVPAGCASLQVGRVGGGGRGGEGVGVGVRVAVWVGGSRGGSWGE